MEQMEEMEEMDNVNQRHKVHWVEVGPEDWARGGSESGTREEARGGPINHDWKSPGSSWEEALNRGCEVYA